jgi:lactoylglutathione lyase
MTKAKFKRAAPYAKDALNLPVANVDQAVPFYQKTFAFQVVSRRETPHCSVILARDEIQIGLAENGGDPTQEGCFFEVDDIEAAYQEIKGTPPSESAFRLDQIKGAAYRVFFVVAPDGLCYMLGQRQNVTRAEN